MIQPKHKKFEIKIEGELFTKETAVKNLLVYRRMIKGKSIFLDQEGLIFEREIGKLTRHETPDIKYNAWHVVNNKLLDSLRKYGWAGEDGHYNHFDKYVSKTPYCDLPKKDYSLIKLEDDAHMIYDHKLEPLPVAIYFDYIMANIRSTRYDLEKITKILNKNPNVRFEICNDLIPYYNNESGLERHSSFWWAPTLKEYRKMWAECLRIGGKYPSTNRFNAIVNLDLLGIEKARLNDK